MGYRVGARHPLDQGAAGKAILLGREPGSAPYAETSGELQAGARGLAAPVLGVDGLEASVGIVTLGDFDVDQLGPQVVRGRRRGGRAARLTPVQHCRDSTKASR